MVDGLGLGALDKPAGVDNGQITARRVAGNLKARLLQQIEHLLGVDLIFGTAQTDHADFFSHNAFLPAPAGRNYSLFPIHSSLTPRCVSHKRVEIASWRAADSRPYVRFSSSSVLHQSSKSASRDRSYRCNPARISP